MSKETIENNGFLKKHVNAVHCTNNMTLVQRKAMNVLLANAYNDLLNKDEFSIDVKTLCLLMGFNSKNLSKLKTALTGLMSTVVEWAVLDEHSIDDDKRWKASPLLGGVDIYKGICRYEYSKTLKELFYHPSMYAKINLKVQSEFKSSYALALYENCARYVGINQTSWFKLDEVRKILGATGKTYDHYGSFKKRVLDIAIKEVNEKAEFDVKAEFKKEGRAVSEIKFLIDSSVAENEVIEASKELSEVSIEISKVQEQLVKEFKVSESIVAKLFAEYGAVYLQEKMDILKDMPTFKNGQIKNTAGALVDLIKNPDKYKKPVKSKDNANDKARAKISKEQKKRKKKDEIDKLDKNYSNYVNKSVAEYLENLTDKELASMRTEFVSFCREKKYDAVGNQARTGDLSNILVRPIFNKWVIDNCLSDVVLSKEKFSTHL